MFVKSIKPSDGPEIVGPYSPAVKLSDFVYLSGQLPIDPATGELAAGGIGPQTHQSIQNMISLLAEMGLELRHVVKTTVYITDMAMFGEVNQIYASYFDEPYPARTCVQVAALPKGALIEIEALVIDTLRYEKPSEKSCCDSCGGCSR